ncbi:YbhB/YbcL family Raf kinase inhibitor-like protein [Marinobacter sp. CA1]|uniref:YbhB/YbcL family Raf kinase inhibitor-like protein n=1 Tax=Marinobacter sp. CA1 TaxID=2817656 RepID=UPI002B4B279C|nr:YbhB/YbcL family Raf kinase inhibitor-like protein [Marinobacter sp. CA1]
MTDRSRFFRHHRLLPLMLGSVLSTSALADSFQLHSPDLGEPATMQSRFVFNGFGCQGDNVSPSLRWDKAPDATQSFAVTVYDPDAPTGSGWWHWVAFNLPADTRSLASGASSQGALPEGTVQSRTDYGKPGYGGPCPPEGHGPHRYQFRVYALNVENLPLDENASAAMVGFMLNHHALATAELEVTYER